MSYDLVLRGTSLDSRKMATDIARMAKSHPVIGIYCEILPGPDRPNATDLIALEDELEVGSATRNEFAAFCELAKLSPDPMSESSAAAFLDARIGPVMAFFSFSGDPNSEAELRPAYQAMKEFAIERNLVLEDPQLRSRPIDPLDLEWGTATPELVNSDSGVAVHVVNHSLLDSGQLERNVIFLRSRIAFFERHLPPGMRQHVILDDRGQNIPAQIRQSLRAALETIASFEYMSERK